MDVNYLPYMERTRDHQYQGLLKRILRDGDEVDTQQKFPARKVVGHVLRFLFKNGFPIITERDLYSAGQTGGSQFNAAVGELCAFLNGAQTLDEMRAFGCGFWKDWVTKEKCGKRGLAEGDLGPGSYGAAWTRFPTANGEPFNQVSNLVAEARSQPHLRTLFMSPWIPQYTSRAPGNQQQVVVCPCHGWVHLHLYPDTRQLDLLHFQRSADAPVGLVFNVIEYAALALMLGQVLGYQPRELVHVISDAHIYTGKDGKTQLDAVEKLLAVEPQRLPTVTFTEEGLQVTDLTAFRPHHFQVADYYPQNGRMKIWTPI